MIFHLFFNLCLCEFDFLLITVFLSIDIGSSQCKYKSRIPNIHIQITWVQCFCDRNASFRPCTVMCVCDYCKILIIFIRIIGWSVSDLRFSRDQSFFDFFPCIIDFFTIDFHRKYLTGRFPVILRTEHQCFFHFTISQQIN